MSKADMIYWGRKLVSMGFCTSFFGNISFRDEKFIYITKSSTMLDELSDDDIIKVDLRSYSHPMEASSEYIVHKGIYDITDYTHIIHAHTDYATLMDLFDHNYVTYDYGETLGFLKRVPIVKGKSGSNELMKNMSSALAENPVAIAFRHGIFAAGGSFKECYIYLSALEYYSKEKYYRRIFDDKTKRDLSQG